MKSSESPEDGRWVELLGGNSHRVERRGDVVRRGSGPWTPAVHALLRHLRAEGLDWVPEPIGVDAEGRELVTYLAGDVPRYPLPKWVWTDAVLTTAAGWMAAAHELTGGLDRAGPWQAPAHEPAEVICHNDFAPYNFVFDGRHRLVGVIDWDRASPGPRAWDLAYLAYRLVPLASPANPDALASSTPERSRRLALLAGAYGGGVPAASGAAGGGGAPAPPARVIATTAVHRLRELAESTSARAAAGAGHLAAHVRLYVDDAAWIADHVDDLAP